MLDGDKDENGSQYKSAIFKVDDWLLTSGVCLQCF